MALYCGIDLGTTNSTVSIIQVKRREIVDPVDRLKTIPIYQFDENLQMCKTSVSLPSALYFDLDNETVYTGRYAKKIYGDGDRPMQTIRSIKTRIGGDSLVEIPHISDSSKKQHFNMVQCSALFLKTIKQSVEKQYDEKIEGAVVTVPAAFNNDERQATKNAMLLAGFKQVYILDEPTAALLYYINDTFKSVEGKEIGEDVEYRLVYDIGGGTLDISIAKMYENDDGDIELKIVERSPIMPLGGDDFDQYLASYFLADFEKVRPSIEKRSVEDQNRIIARIVSHAEREKIAINEKIKEAFGNERKLKRIKQFVNFEVIDNMNISNMKLTKEVLDEVFYELISSEQAKILEPIKETLSKAGLNKEDICEVILTGGMSNFYAVQETLKNYFGQDIEMILIDTESAVSKGAAIHHYHQEEDEGVKLKLTDINPYDIFIKVGGSFQVLIQRTVQPGECGTFEYEIPEDGLGRIAVFLYYGSGNSTENYIPISGKFIELNEPKKKGDKIQLSWKLDNDKIINIYISELDEELKIKSSNEYTEEMIIKDSIHRLNMNGGEI